MIYSYHPYPTLPTMDSSIDSQIRRVLLGFVLVAVGTLLLLCLLANGYIMYQFQFYHNVR